MGAQTITATIMQAIDEDGITVDDGGWIVHLYSYVEAGICQPWGTLPIAEPTVTTAVEALTKARYQVTGDWTLGSSYAGPQLVAVVEPIPTAPWTPPVMSWTATH